MKKIFTLLVMALLSTASMFAKFNKEGWTVGGEFGIGSQMEFGVRGQYNLNQYLAIDAPVFKYNFDYGDVNYHEVKIMAGARGFSPEFGPSLKAFMAFDLGYGGTVSEYTDWESCFAFDFTIGLSVWKGIYVGYGLGGLSNGGTHKDHVFRIGYNFAF